MHGREDLPPSKSHTMKLTGIAITALVIAGLQVPKAVHAYNQGVKGAQAVCRVATTGGTKAQAIQAAEGFTYANHWEWLAEDAFKHELKTNCTAITRA